MPAPIPDYTTPTDNYDTPVSPATTGLNFNRAQDAGLQAAAPMAKTLQADAALKDQNTQAAQYQQLLNSGISGMQAYVTDLSKDYPDIAKNASARLETMTPWISSLKGEERVKAAHEFYDNVNSRVVAAKMGGMLNNGVAGPDGKKVQPTNDQLIAIMTNPKDMVASRIKGETADTGAKKASAMSEYYKGFPALKEKIAIISANARVRAASLRAMDGGKSGRFQFTMDNAQKNLKSVNDDIADLIKSDPSKNVTDPDTGKPMPESDPRYAAQVGLIRATDGWNKWSKQMAELIKERNTYQSWANHAAEKGAKPGDSIGTDEVEPLEPTAKSTDAEISQYLKANGKPVTPEYIQLIRSRLGGDSTQAER